MVPLSSYIESQTTIRPNVCCTETDLGLIYFLTGQIWEQRCRLCGFAGSSHWLQFFFIAASLFYCKLFSLLNFSLKKMLVGKKAACGHKLLNGSHERPPPPPNTSFIIWPWSKLYWTFKLRNLALFLNSPHWQWGQGPPGGPGQHPGQDHGLCHRWLIPDDPWTYVSGGEGHLEPLSDWD